MDVLGGETEVLKPESVDILESQTSWFARLMIPR